METVTKQELIKQITYIASKPKYTTTAETKFIEYMTRLISNIPLCESAQEWSDHIDQDMYVEFEREILEKYKIPSLQDVLSDDIYSIVQDLRNAYQDILDQKKA